MRRYAREQNEILKEQFSRVSSREPVLGNQNIQAKRSIEPGRIF